MLATLLLFKMRPYYSNGGGGSLMVLILYGRRLYVQIMEYHRRKDFSPWATPMVPAYGAKLRTLQALDLRLLMWCSRVFGGGWVKENKHGFGLIYG